MKNGKSKLVLVAGGTGFLGSHLCDALIEGAHVIALDNFLTGRRQTCRVLSGEDITVYGDGSQSRSFCYVSDLIDGFMRLMAYEGEQSGAVNLGDPLELTVGELAARMLSMTGSSSRIVRRPLTIDDPRRCRPNIARAEQLLSRSPTTPLEGGLRETITLVRERK